MRDASSPVAKSTQGRSSRSPAHVHAGGLQPGVERLGRLATAGSCASVRHQDPRRAGGAGTRAALVVAARCGRRDRVRRAVEAHFPTADGAGRQGRWPSAPPNTWCATEEWPTRCALDLRGPCVGRGIASTTLRIPRPGSGASRPKLPVRWNPLHSTATKSPWPRQCGHDDANLLPRADYPGRLKVFCISPSEAKRRAENFCVWIHSGCDRREGATHEVLSASVRPIATVRVSGTEQRATSSQVESGVGTFCILPAGCTGSTGHPQGLARDSPSSPTRRPGIAPRRNRQHWNSCEPGPPMARVAATARNFSPAAENALIG